MQEHKTKNGNKLQSLMYACVVVCVCAFSCVYGTYSISKESLSAGKIQICKIGSSIHLIKTHNYKYQIAKMRAAIWITKINVIDCTELWLINNLKPDFKTFW